MRYSAKVINGVLSDNINYLYLIFLSPLVSESERVNAFYQSTNPDPGAMSQELDLLYRGRKSRVFDKHDKKLTITASDFRAHFMNELSRCSKEDILNMAINNAVTGLSVT